MVMWEILTRRVPFDDRAYLFAHKLLNDVVAGIRPSIPDSSPQDFVMVLEDCWQTEAARRPSFREVARRLALQRKS